MLNNLTSIFRQKPLVALDFNNILGNGESKQTIDIPCIGWTLLYGMIYSSQEISFIVEQGSKYITYRTNRSYTIGIQECIELEIPITGKFLRITLTNNSGLDASVESFFCLRGIE